MSLFSMWVKQSWSPIIQSVLKYLMNVARLDLPNLTCSRSGSLGLWPWGFWQLLLRVERVCKFYFSSLHPVLLSDVKSNQAIPSRFRTASVGIPVAGTTVLLYCMLFVSPWPSEYDGLGCLLVCMSTRSQRFLSTP